MRTVHAGLQLALWVGRKGRGAARLRWGGNELVLYVSALQIVGASGDDGEQLSSGLGLFEGGEWFSEAQRAVEQGHVTQAEANAVVKRVVADRLRSFLINPTAEISFEGEAAVGSNALAISFSHLMVELVLGPGGEKLLPLLLPDPSVTLRRLPDFPRRVGSLGLTEEGMAILAKVDERRTAAEIAKPSPHGAEMVLRLLAAALAAGIVEAVPPLSATLLEKPSEAAPAPEARKRRWWLWLLALALVGAAAAYIARARPWEWGADPGKGGPWGVAVDSGCQPAEVERLYRRQEADEAAFRVVPFGRSEEQCFRLLWGHFATREAAEAAMTQLPANVLARGFVPHVVRGTEPTPAAVRR